MEMVSVDWKVRVEGSKDGGGGLLRESLEPEHYAIFVTDM